MFFLNGVWGGFIVRRDFSPCPFGCNLAVHVLIPVEYDERDHRSSEHNKDFINTLYGSLNMPRK